MTRQNVREQRLNLKRLRRDKKKLEQMWRLY